MGGGSPRQPKAEASSLRRTSPYVRALILRCAKKLEFPLKKHSITFFNFCATGYIKTGSALCDAGTPSTAPEPSECMSFGAVPFSTAPSNEDLFRAVRDVVMPARRFRRRTAPPFKRRKVSHSGRRQMSRFVRRVNRLGRAVFRRGARFRRLHPRVAAATRIGRMLPIYAMPKQRMIAFNYYQSFQIDTNVVDRVFTIRFNPRNPNKPNVRDVIAGIPGSHQPYGWDQWALFYEEFAVMSAKVTVNTFDAAPGADSIMQVWGLQTMRRHKYDEVDDIEYHKGRERRLIPAGTVTNRSEGDGRKTFLRTTKTGRWDFRKWYGNRFPVRDQFTAYTSTPADVEGTNKEPFFVVWVCSPESLSADVVKFQIRITYVVQLRHLKPVTHS